MARPLGLKAFLKPLLSLRVFSWAMYDFANTIWSMNILSLYFALWVTVDHGAPDLAYSLASSLSMLAIAFSSPMLGAISDQYGRRLPFLVFFTLACVTTTALIGVVGSLLAALLLFALANYCYQSGTIYYDAMLTTVSEQEVRGKVSGFGVSLGYAGAILGVLMVKPFVDAGGRGAAFLPSALLFLLFSLPCFLFVREPRVGLPWSLRQLREGYIRLLSTLRQAPRYANLLRFIIARFFYLDSVNTLIAFMAVYTVKVVGFSNAAVQTLLIFSTTFAVVGSLFYGWVVDHIGPKRSLTLILFQWALVFLAAAITFYPPAFYAIGALAGLTLGATWTSDRVLLTRLSPPEKLGEFFGLYGLAGRLAAVVGPLLWGLTTWWLVGWGLVSYRIAILVLLTTLVGGFLVLLGVKEEPRVAIMRGALDNR